MRIHIHAPKGHYIGQIRRYGHRRWETVTGNCKTYQQAMSKAVLAMQEDHKRARVIFHDSGGWYGPVVVMEGSV